MNESSLTNNLKYDVILCDPPWGGFDYAGKDKSPLNTFRHQMYLYASHGNGGKRLPPLWNGPLVELELGGVPIREVIRDVFLAKRCK